MIYHWRSDDWTCHILNLIVCKYFPLATDVPCGSLTGPYRSYTGTSWWDARDLLHVLSYHTLSIYLLFMCLAWLKHLNGWSFMPVFLWVPLLTLWSMLVGMLFSLALAWWKVSSLMPHKVNLSCLGVTCNCFDVV